MQLQQHRRVGHGSTELAEVRADRIEDWHVNLNPAAMLNPLP